jgi:hypothetical protein
MNAIATVFIAFFGFYSLAEACIGCKLPKRFETTIPSQCTGFTPRPKGAQAPKPRALGPQARKPMVVKKRK